MLICPVCFLFKQFCERGHIISIFLKRHCRSKKWHALPRDKQLVSDKAGIWTWVRLLCFGNTALHHGTTCDCFSHFTGEDTKNHGANHIYHQPREQRQPLWAFRRSCLSVFSEVLKAKSVISGSSVPGPGPSWLFSSRLVFAMCLISLPLVKKSLGYFHH